MKVSPRVVFNLKGKEYHNIARVQVLTPETRNIGNVSPVKGNVTKTKTFMQKVMRTNECMFARDCVDKNPKNQIAACEPLGVEERAGNQGASPVAFQASAPQPGSPTAVSTEGESAPLDDSELL